MNRILILTTVCMMCIPTAFSLLLLGSDKSDSGVWFLAAILLFITGIVAWDKAVMYAREEDRIRNQQTQSLINELRGFRQDFRNRGRSLGIRRWEVEGES